jgi:glyoxylase-like metal-dependent hydrolase (beta-lactamase superfamily II)
MQNDKCKTARVGKRGTLFIFRELEGLETCVYVIDGPKHAFVVDTFLGPKSMAIVKKRMGRALRGRPVVVINGHYHWDHIWGNCAFPKSQIVAHSLCRERIERIGAKELKAYGSMQQGNVKLVLPNCTFTDRLVYQDDGVELLHSPGHSPDSISVFDRTDNVLLVGDNVERPLPYLYSTDLDAYERTLRSYLSSGARRIIAGHCARVTRDTIRGNLAYVRAFRNGGTGKYDTGQFRQTHRQNLRVMELLKSKGNK